MAATKGKNINPRVERKITRISGVREVKQTFLIICEGVILLVATQFPFNLLHEPILFQRFSVIYVARSKHKVKYLAFIIDNQMRFKSEEPSHRTFASLGKSLECLVNQYPLITADT